MNFLDLCRKAARDSGTLAGGGLSVFTTVEAASGRGGKIVGWVSDAWVNIQNEHDDWMWMQREFGHALTIGEMRYSAASLGVDRLGKWITSGDCEWPFTIYEPTSQADENPLRFIPYETWRARYARGAHDAGRPIEFSVSPQMEIVVGPKPDRAYVVSGEYVASPQVLAADTDIPEMPAQYHNVIVWEAIKLMSISDEAAFALQTSVGEYARIRDALSRDQRPKVRISYSPDTVIA